MGSQTAGGGRVGVASLEAATRGPWMAAGLAACGCALVAVVDPTEHPLTPPCPFRAVTGWWCPLCGSTRALSRLVRADVGGAFRYNALLVLALPALVAGWVLWARGGGTPEWLGRRVPRLLTAVAMVALGFTVLRNLPSGVGLLRGRGA